MLFGWAALEGGSDLEGWSGAGHWGVSTFKKGVGGISVKLFEGQTDAVRYARDRVRAAKSMRYFIFFAPEPGDARNLRVTHRVRLAHGAGGEVILVQKAAPCRHRNKCPDGYDWHTDKTLTVALEDPEREADMRAARGTTERISREDRGTEPRGHAQKRTRMGRPGDVKGPASEVRFPGVPGARRREAREQAAREERARRTREQAEEARQAHIAQARQRITVLRREMVKLNDELERIDAKIAAGRGTARDEGRREVVDVRIIEIEKEIRKLLKVK